jgi:hypothetical protein
VSVETVIPLWAFFVVFDILAELRRIKTTWSLSVFSVVIIHAVFVIMSLSFVTRDSFEVVYIEVLNILSVSVL